jgi:hypothetical protein
MELRYEVNSQLPKFSFKYFEAKLKNIPLVFAELIKTCLNIRPELRPKCEDLMKHPAFEEKFREEIESELEGKSLRKVKRKGFVNPNHTPEPQSYLRIYEKKKSPQKGMRSKNSEDRIRFRNKSPIQPLLEKSVLLPGISRNEKSFIIKPTPTYTKKHLEIKSNSKAAIGTYDSIARTTMSRNTSLSYETSVDTLLNPLSKFDLSNRNKNFKKIEIFNSSSEIQRKSILPIQYSLKKRKNS